MNLWLRVVIALALVALTLAWLLRPPLKATGLTPNNSAAAPTLAAQAAPLRILIIGGSRGVGLETAQLALRRGHRVTVMARSAPTAFAASDQLAVTLGSITDSSLVASAMRDQDVVITTVGATPSRREIRVFSDGMKNVLAALEQNPAQRLLAVTGIGAGESRGHGGFGYDRIFQPLLLGKMYADKDREEALIRASAANWLIVRPGFLRNGPAAQGYRVAHSLDGVRAGSITRADVAHFLVAAAESAPTPRQAVLLTN